MLTGWDFARPGKKATEFDLVCKVLGVEFNFTLSADGILLIGNILSQEEMNLLRCFQWHWKRARWTKLLV